MKTLLEKVRIATKALGEAPYNDKKAAETASKGAKGLWNDMKNREKINR